MGDEVQLLPALSDEETIEIRSWLTKKKVPNNSTSDDKTTSYVPIVSRKKVVFAGLSRDDKSRFFPWLMALTSLNNKNHHGSSPPGKNHQCDWVLEESQSTIRRRILAEEDHAHDDDDES